MTGSQRQFEDWVTSQKGCILKKGGEYINPYVGYAWQAWQASRQSVVVVLPDWSEYDRYEQYVYYAASLELALDAAGVAYR